MPLAHHGHEMEMVSRTAETTPVTIEDLFLVIGSGDVVKVKATLDGHHEKGWKAEVGGCGRTALQVACSFRNVEIVQLLAKYGWSVNAKDSKGKTSLHYASINGSIDIAKMLISLGAEVSAKDRWGQTPLHLASHYGDTEMCLLLLQNGSDTKKKDSTGQTAMQVAATPAVKDFLMESMKSLKIN